ncbi:MAG: hypothetical protein II723_01550 [Oscillospiraceae bacterium]|nr:hypothetical protein [Oscillospiraceae bacterium]
MANSGKTKERRHGISCLGVLLVICMLLLAGVTIAVNLLFSNQKAPKFGKHSLCYYDADTMGAVTIDDAGTLLESGSLIVAEQRDEINAGDLVLYSATTGQCRIGRVGLREQADAAALSAVRYYLTVGNDPEPKIIAEQDIRGVCKSESKELGVFVGFLLGTTGILVGVILPCLVLLLYLAAAVVAAKEANQAEEEAADDDDDTDLAFVKSIQKKQQQIAERDAERQGGHSAAEPAADARRPRRLSDEEMAEMEEQEAARRAERIAAVRSHMEQRRQTDTPDGVPLYTTEVITRTHTLPLPRTGELSITRQIPRQGMTGQIPRPGTTGQIPRQGMTGQIPRQGTTGQIPRPGTTGQIPRPGTTGQIPRQGTTGQIPRQGTTGPIPRQGATAPIPKAVQEQPAAAQPLVKLAAVPEPAAEPVKPAAPAAPPASYEELMAMLDEEIKKLTPQ